MQEVKRGSRGPAVVAMKKRLKAHGFWGRWPITQGFGRVTEGQVRKFQAQNGLLVDGIVGPATWAVLNDTPVKGERARAVRWAAGKVGVIEHPPESNRGPGPDGISAMQLASIGFDGAAWCQCFCSFGAQLASRGRLKASWFGGYTPAVVDMANRGAHGLKRVKLSEARPGDWVYFKFPGVSSDFCDHVEVFISDAGSEIKTIGGNTSSGSAGSQNNGGGVFRRVRSKDLVVAVVRVPYKD